MILVWAVLKIVQGHFAKQPRGTGADWFGTFDVEMEAGRSNAGSADDILAHTCAVFGVVFHLQYPFR